MHQLQFTFNGKLNMTEIVCLTVNIADVFCL
jgi:hypothetical protein